MACYSQEGGDIPHLARPQENTGKVRRQRSEGSMETRERLYCAFLGKAKQGKHVYDWQV